MPNFLRPFISGIVAALVAGAVAWLAAKNINVSQDTQQQIVEYVVAGLMTLFGTTFHVVNKLVAKWTNPGDAATSQLAAEHVIENEQLKAADSNHPSVIH